MLRTKGATSAVINKLVKKGLVRKDVKEENQRVTRLFMTKEGFQVHDAHLSYDIEKVQEWMGRIAIEEEKLAAASEVMESFTEFYWKNILNNSIGEKIGEAYSYGVRYTGDVGFTNGGALISPRMLPNPFVMEPFTRLRIRSSMAGSVPLAMRIVASPRDISIMAVSRACCSVTAKY